jgi:hypothetical protein
MAAAGVNTVRTYTPPSRWLYDQLAAAGLRVVADVPWPKHVCFLSDRAARAEARRLARAAAAGGRDHPARLAYAVANEVPPDVIRWHGRRRVGRFLAELADVVRQADPGGLVTYANFPSTEYLDTPFVDFHTFNLYLERPQAFRDYVARLLVLSGEKPLVLGELGLDAVRNGDEAQGRAVAGQLEDAFGLGAAGAFVFSWTDDWFTGGDRVTDWGFGLVRADRTPKPAYRAVAEVFSGPLPPQPLPAPRVSVVVCAYNAAATLDECLDALLRLNYPDYEVVVVDDGSTDRTAEVLAGFPAVRVIRQENRGLAAARNAGLAAATGEVVAYTDADCAADPDWLMLLVGRLTDAKAAGAGGPNLSPDDGWLAACVAAAPGQPHEMLEPDGGAEHLPGCNMAFWRDDLEEIGGFDPRFRTAGDDVDVCWRLLDAGRRLAFAPAAVVWHHRRPSPRAYLRQQAGYGNAEGQLQVKHPARFGALGYSKWKGAAPARAGGPAGRRPVYRGVFGAGLFQCVYYSGDAHWLLWPSTVEWHAVAVLAALAAGAWAWPAAAAVLGGMLAASAVLAVWRAAHAPVPGRHGGPRTRCVVALLQYAQPLVRGFARYRRRLLSRYTGDTGRPPGPAAAAYWSEGGAGREQLLHELLRRADRGGWSVAVDPGWSDWDLEAYGGPLARARLVTAEEGHGGNRRLVRARLRVGPTPFAKILFLAFGLTAAAAGLATPAAALPGAAVSGVVLLFTARDARRANRLAGLLGDAAAAVGMTRLTR